MPLFIAGEEPEKVTYQGEEVLIVKVGTDVVFTRKIELILEGGSEVNLASMFASALSTRGEDISTFAGEFLISSNGSVEYTSSDVAVPALSIGTGYSDTSRIKFNESARIRCVGATGPRGAYGQSGQSGFGGRGGAGGGGVRTAAMNGAAGTSGSDGIDGGPGGTGGIGLALNGSGLSIDGPHLTPVAGLGGPGGSGGLGGLGGGGGGAGGGAPLLYHSSGYYPYYVGGGGGGGSGQYHFNSPNNGGLGKLPYSENGRSGSTNSYGGAGGGVRVPYQGDQYRTSGGKGGDLGEPGGEAAAASSYSRAAGGDPGPAGTNGVDGMQGATGPEGTAYTI